MVSNTRLIFKKVPRFHPIVGQHISLETGTFDLDAEPPEGGLTVKNLYISFDPYQRGCMREPDDATWAPPFVPGQPIICGAVAQILRSTVSTLRTGDLVWGMFGAEEYSIVPSILLPYVRKLDNELELDPILFTSALGTAGLSAYGSFYGIGKPKKGQTIFISAASGGVGQIVGQLAKLEGLRVIGSVGSEEKQGFIGIDIYFDNVGGETLDAALATIKDFGTIISCGMISQYNLPIGEKYGVQNMMNIFLKRLTIQGFIVSDPQFLSEHAAEFFASMSVWLKEGKIKTKESVTVGMQNAATCYSDMFTGRNFGKAVLKVADAESEQDGSTRSI
ncbi:putative zinc-type alcohol dehydrogenase-like protein PB24D3.08c [Lophiostoma macrostomum CBS 122681]|uniref:Putative zinc-type alcohol dehydrogenase-like protein PB24D3.08c n=1 Tax=Lophiostoma macrostomum CBS 122681 TaxID=1314788 RepID=A0A6A6T6P5_9PLEO|nr:putative zinc-type alcohol dehydrogenase-like protein PB24D3.08c [Lophiostoma macrostomum CBS 122681]